MIFVVSFWRLKIMLVSIKLGYNSSEQIPIIILSGFFCNFDEKTVFQ